MYQHDAGAHDVALVDGPDVDAGNRNADGWRLEELQQRLERAQRRRLHAHALACTHPSDTEETLQTTLTCSPSTPLATLPHYPTVIHTMLVVSKHM